ncbi:MAG: LytTR family DNA-binding domain-containing protein [Ignavibacteriota bacterium]
MLLDTDEVLAFQAERELVWIVTAKQRLLATQPLWGIEERLSTSHFRRVHRNALVNVSHIRKLSALSSQRWLITLSNALQIVLANVRPIISESSWIGRGKSVHGGFKPAPWEVGSAGQN